MGGICAFKLVPKAINFATIGGTIDQPCLLRKETILLPADQTSSEYVAWAETQIGLILNAENPDLIVFKLPSPTGAFDQIFKVYFGLAILVLDAAKRGIEAKHYAAQSLRKKAFGIGPEDDIDDYVRELFDPQDKPWNKDIREAASCALLEMRRG